MPEIVQTGSASSAREASFEGVDAAELARLSTIALARGADHADVFLERTVSGALVLEDGVLRTVERDVSQGVGVRACRGEATGYAYTEDWTLEAMRSAARTAAQIAEGGRSGRALAPRPVALPRRYTSLSTIDLDGRTKRALLARADAAARAADPRVVRVEVSWTEERRDVAIATSDGRWAREVRPLVRFLVSTVVEQRGVRRAGRSGGGGRVDLDGLFADRSPEDHAREAVREAVAMLDTEPAPAGVMDVVIAPGQGGVLLHEAVGHGLEADVHRKGTSRYVGRLGERVASSLCTVVDDARIADARGSLAVDDEGVVPEAITLIEGGTLRATMSDRRSAAHFGVASSGNGRRESFRFAPMPRMTNTLLLAGPHDPEEIRESVERGLYVRKIRGGEVDVGNGDFVFTVAEGYRIERGRIGAPVVGVNLVGNGPEVMGRVTMLGRDFAMAEGTGTCGKDGQSVPVGVGCPTMKIAGMTVGGTRTG